MNGQISDYSAAYGSRSGGGMPAGTGRSQQPSSMMNAAQQGAPSADLSGGSRTEVRQMPGLGFAGGLGTARQEPQQSIAFPGAGIPLADISQGQPASAESLQYLNGFLRTQIGNRLRVEFLVGTNTYLEKSGKLVAVGANYIILQQSMSDDLLVCDFFNIKFITIFR